MQNCGEWRWHVGENPSRRPVIGTIIGTINRAYSHNFRARSQERSRSVFLANLNRINYSQRERVQQDNLTLRSGSASPSKNRNRMPVWKRKFCLVICAFHACNVRNKRKKKPFDNYCSKSRKNTSGKARSVDSPIRESRTARLLFHLSCIRIWVMHSIRSPWLTNYSFLFPVHRNKPHFQSISIHSFFFHFPPSRFLFPPHYVHITPDC